MDERTRSIPEEKMIKFDNLRLLDTNKMRKSVLGVTQGVYLILASLNNNIIQEFTVLFSTEKSFIFLF